MKVNPIRQQNYNNGNRNISFQGTIDKSFTNYLKDVRKDVIKTSKKRTSGDVDEIKKTTRMIKGIMTRLTAIMSQTDENTTLILKKTWTTPFGEELSSLVFKDKSKGTEIPGYTIYRPQTFSAPEEQILIHYPFQVATKPEPENFFAAVLGIRGKHKSTMDLELINSWSENLRKFIEPIEIDRALRHQTLFDETKKTKSFEENQKKMRDSQRKKLEMDNAIRDLNSIKLD